MDPDACLIDIKHLYLESQGRGSNPKESGRKLDKRIEVLLEWIEKGGLEPNWESVNDTVLDYIECRKFHREEHRAVTTQPQPTMRLYIACLASYSNGQPYGDWIDASTNAEEMLEKIKRVLEDSPAPNAEKWAIHDTEGFEPYDRTGEESLEEIAKIVEGCEEYGKPFLMYMNDRGYDAEESIEPMENGAYLGCYKDLESYAYEYCKNTGIFDSIPRDLRHYFDCAAFGNDMDLTGGIWTYEDSDGLHVFDGHV